MQTRRTIFGVSVLLFLVLVTAVRRITVVAPSSVVASSRSVATTELRSEVNAFLGKELATHLSAIKSLDPPPDRVLGALTTGEFSWGTFMRALAAYADTTGERELANRDLAKWV